MIPRLKTSKKWTAFPKEYLEQIQVVFNENFTQFLSNAEIILEGRIYPEEIMLRVGYHEKGALAQANFEVSMGYSQKEQDAIERIHNCVDAAASMMMEYLESEDEEVDFPYLWKEIPFNGKKIYVQFTTENSSLEAQANALLGIDETELLLAEESEDEDALTRAELDEELAPLRDEGYDKEEDQDELPEEDEDSAPSGPKMFGGKKGKLH